MTTLNDFSVTDLSTDVLAAFYNKLLGGILRGEFSNSIVMTTDLTLTDGDTPIQRLNCNGANRIVKMPPNAASNHPFFIFNTTSGSYSVSVKNNAGSLILKQLKVGESVLCLPDGGGNYVIASEQLVTEETEINFGSLPVRSKTFTITEIGMTPTSTLTVSQSAKAATGKAQDENEMDALLLRAVPGTDQFTLYADAYPGPVSGNFKITYQFK